MNSLIAIHLPDVRALMDLFLTERSRTMC